MSKLDTHIDSASYSRWPHLMAIGMMCVTFPLIFVGGLVTTYDAGMAVPDWPNTYGYNMFSYPLRTWWQGPWDLFIEHGHRLLGTFSGLFAIFFLVAVWRCDPRRWMKWAALIALLLVIGQGLLGGVRVLSFDQEIAKIHGCVGPLFFSYTALLTVLTSRQWFRLRDKASYRAIAGTGLLEATNHAGQGTGRLGIAIFLLAYMQLFLGANLRHFSVEAPPTAFATLVVLHLILAAVVVLHAGWLWLRSRTLTRRLKKLVDSAERSTETDSKSDFETNRFAIRRHFARLHRWTLALFVFTLLQTSLGLGTWVVKYGIPAWVADLGFAAHYVPVAKSMLQANVVTFHVAIGSLILAVSVSVAARALGARQTSKQSHAEAVVDYGVAS